MNSLGAESCPVGSLLGGVDTLLLFFFSLSESRVVYVWVGNKSLPCERSAQS